MKLIKGRWTDENGNQWDVKKYTKKEAKFLSKTLVDCYDCRDCRYCNYCRLCNRCTGCRYCYDCDDCCGCRYCNYCCFCHCCRNCHECHRYIGSPMRYTTDRIGSRDDQTTFYYGDTDKGKSLQVVCGCFRGNLEEFEAAVLDTHKDNEIYRNQYLTEIAKVRVLFELEENR